MLRRWWIRVFRPRVSRPDTPAVCNEALRRAENVMADWAIKFEEQPCVGAPLKHAAHDIGQASAALQDRRKDNAG